MGPTGSGKSSFIEAMAENRSLGISKDQLEGYTQSVTSYKLVNAAYQTDRSPTTDPMTVYLVDTPGFCDSKMSELDIIEKTREWMAEHGISFIHHILYLLPINDTRLSGKKKRVIEMFKSLVRGPGRHLTIITTMWDKIWSDEGKRSANSNFGQLIRETWQDYHGHGTIVTRFLNTHQSALDVLGEALSIFTAYPNVYDPLLKSSNVRSKQLINMEIGQHLHRDLVDRIEALKRQKQDLELDLLQSETQKNEELVEILEAQLGDVKFRLQSLTLQMDAFCNGGTESEKAASPQSSGSSQSFIATLISKLNLCYGSLEMHP
ncbi:hypothetical protein CVT24_003909 [Panaeolus cyanescens]|uniref:G domain-containing protein n=1 Tax=Panaeolus cyanescens TaxID=181874 RepID=A0A409VVD1_9AGAR|nr:hypothetical protein CVT24_003909 [Panaeolus cyanescens]